MADGIGGYEGGEVASAVTVATLVEVVSARAGPPEERLLAAVLEANRRILELQAVRDSELVAMGTTLTAMAFDPEGRVAVAHVGDSRLYRLEEGGLVQLTQDHNVGTELVREGLIEAADLTRHPQRHMLTRAVGASADLRPDVFALAVAGGESYLLTTDGLIDALGEAEVARIAHAWRERWPEVGPALAEAASRRHNGDDATVVAVRVEGPAEEGRP